MLLLFFGAYAIHHAELEFAKIGLSKSKDKTVQESRTESDLTHIKKVMSLSLSTGVHTHENAQRSLIVKDSKIIGLGWDTSSSTGELFAHAELQAIREACKFLNRESLKGCTVYSSAEPCPMCHSLLYMTGIDKIVYYVGSSVQHSTRADSIHQTIYKTLLRDRSQRSIPELRFYPSDLTNSEISIN